MNGELREWRSEGDAKICSASALDWELLDDRSCLGAQSFTGRIDTESFNLWREECVSPFVLARPARPFVSSLFPPGRQHEEVQSIPDEGSCSPLVDRLHETIPESIRFIQDNELKNECEGPPGGVSKATWAYGSKPVVIKSMAIDNAEQADCFVHELNLAHRCASQPHIAKIIGWKSVIIEKRFLCGKIVMEDCGISLGKYFSGVEACRFSRPSGTQRIQLMLDYADAIRFLQDIEHVHGDIHPGNLMVKMISKTRIGGYLIDLGNSMNINDHEWKSNLSYWMAPEVQDSVYTKSSDVFSFGITMLSIAQLKNVGHAPPCTAFAEREPLLAILAEFTKTRSVNVTIPTEFDDLDDGHSSRLRSIICRCLSFNPSERGSMETVCLELRELFEAVALVRAQPSKARFFPCKCFSISNVKY